MSGRRNFNPRSVYMNERSIQREQKRFDSGMVLDGEAREVGPGQTFARGTRKLVNARGYSDCIAGAPGTTRLTGADFGVAIQSSSESLATAIQTGQLFVANGNEIPVTGAVFEILGTIDLSNNPLATAKGTPLKKYDYFKITTTGVTYLGNIRIPGIHGYGDRYETELTCSKTGTTITKTSGTAFNIALLGTYFLWPAGTRERIIEVTDGTHLKTEVASTINSTAGCIIQGKIHASWNFKHLSTIVVLSHNRIYMSQGVPPLGWKEITIIGTARPGAEFSRFHEDGNDLLLVNATGIYRIIISATPYAIKLNCKAPITLLEDTVSADATMVGYRAVYTMSRIVGSVYTDDRMCASRGAVLQHESAPVVREEITGKDYGEKWIFMPQGGIPILDWNGFAAPSNGAQHYTHFSLYRTKDISAIGLSSGNLRNLLVWVKDCPIGKAFVVHGTSSHHVAATEGTFTIDDVGCRLQFQDGTSGIIQTFVGYTGVPGETEIILEWTSAGPPMATQSASIGEGKTLTVSQSGFILTITTGVSLNFAYEGNQIFLASGKIIVITRVIDATHALVDLEYTYTETGAVLNPKIRAIRDTITDEVLQQRIESGKQLYFLQHRYFSPLPSTELGWMIPGFLFVANSSKNTYYYCNTARKHLTGSYHPEKMTCDKITDGIQQIRYFPGKVLFRCNNCTYQLSTTVSTEGGDISIGEEYQVLGDPEMLDDVIGVPGDSSSRLLQNGQELVWTSEPAVRIFDGTKYGDNLAEKLVMSEIRKYYPNVRIAYSPTDGIHLWGEQAQ